MLLHFFSTLNTFNFKNSEIFSAGRTVRLNASGKQPVQTQTIPASSCVRIKAFYNNLFLQQFNGNHETAKDAIRNIIQEANKIFKLPGLPSAVTLNILEGE